SGRIDRDTGRVYRLGAANEKRGGPNNLAARSTDKLLPFLDSDNRWVKETVLRILGDRRDPVAIEPLKEIIRENDGEHAVHALWALNLSGGFDEAAAATLLSHKEPQVRVWTIRLLGDNNRFGDLASKIAELALKEDSVHVRSQLAASARRVPVAEALP